MLVSGTGIPPQRQQQIHGVLDRLPHVVVRFDDPAFPAGATPVQSEPAARDAAGPEKSTYPARIEERLGGRPQFERFSSSVLDWTDSAMTRAYALRRLAQQFPAAAENQMTAEDRRTLRKLAREHLAAFTKDAQRVANTVNPVLTGMGAGTAQIEARPESATWQSASEDLLTSARRAETLLAVVLGVAPADKRFRQCTRAVAHRPGAALQPRRRVPAPARRPVTVPFQPSFTRCIRQSPGLLSYDCPIGSANECRAPGSRPTCIFWSSVRRPWAQRSAYIHGRVLDPSQAAVPEAAITIVNQESGFRRVTQTATAGDYAVGSLESGTLQGHRAQRRLPHHDPLQRQSGQSGGGAGGFHTQRRRRAGDHHGGRHGSADRPGGRRHRGARLPRRHPAPSPQWPRSPGPGRTLSRHQRHPRHPRAKPASSPPTGSGPTPTTSPWTAPAPIPA